MSNKMKKLVSIILLLILASNAVTDASVNPAIDRHVQRHVDQAQFLVQNGIPQEEVLKIFKDSLEHEKLSSDKPKSKKMLWTITGCCFVGVVIGGVYYFFIRKPQQQTTPPNQPVLQIENNAPQQRVLPQELIALFDDNAFDQEAAMQVQLEPLIMRAAAARPEILPLYQQHLLAIREHNLENVLEIGQQIREHLLNPEAAAAIQGFVNDYPDQARRIDLIAGEPNRIRRLEAVNRYLENN